MVAASLLHLLLKEVVCAIELPETLSHITDATMKRFIIESCVHYFLHFISKQLLRLSIALLSFFLKCLRAVMNELLTELI